MLRLLAGSALLACACAAVSSSPIPPAGQGRWNEVEEFRPGGEIEAPRVVRRVDPRPPPGLSSTFLRTARVVAVISETGEVLDVWQIDGDREWGRVVVAAVHRWQFEPARRDGIPVRVKFEITSTMSATTTRMF